ncbi:MAG: hypothetical protein WAS33_31140, partial [Candidatus Promineifilaceae bacterium]
PKVAGAGVGELAVVPGAVTAVYTPAQQPIAQTISVTLKNTGAAPLAYTMTVQTMPPLNLNVTGPLTGSLAVGEETAVPLPYSLDGQSVGSYAGSLQIETSSNGVANSQNVPVTVHLWAEIYRTFLPLTVRP